jgi:hypothetical protein
MNQTNTSTIGANVSLVATSASVSWQTWVRLFELPFGTIANFINICVFLNPKLKDLSYTYMIAISSANLAYQGLLFVSTFFSICLICPTYQSYFSALYSLAIGLYFTSCLAIFRIAVEVTLSLHTYCVLTNRTNWITTRFSSKIILTSLFVASVLIYGQVPFANSIVATNTTELVVTYATQTNDFGNSVLGKTIAIVNTSTRLSLAVIVLTIVNVLNLIEFRKRFKSRRVGLLALNNINTQSINNQTHTIGKN